MTRRVKYFQQRCNDYVSELIGLERGLVVHLVVGIHVADVAVVDQVHVTKLFNSTNVVVNHVASTCVNLNFKTELIFTIRLYSSKLVPNRL